MEKKEAEKEKRREAKTSWGVFGFLNKELHTHTGDKNGEFDNMFSVVLHLSHLVSLGLC